MDRKDLIVGEELVYRCQHCGADVPSGLGLLLPGVQLLNVHGNLAECPVCKKLTGGGDGIYSTVGGVVTRIADAAPTPAEWQRLLSVLRSERASRGPVAIARDVEVAVPRLAGVVNPLLGDLAADWHIKLPLLMAALAQVVALLEAPNATTASAAFATAVAATVPFFHSNKERNKRKRLRRHRRNPRA